jgi:hypothetical protein
MNMIKLQWNIAVVEGSITDETKQAFDNNRTKGINKGSFKPLYKNNLGYFIKVGRKEIYLSDEQIKQFKEQRKTINKNNNNTKESFGIE